MDKELIERLAVEAGVCYSLGEHPGELAFVAFEDDDVRDVLCRFAALVAEQCAMIVAGTIGESNANPEINDACSNAVEAIREAFKA